MHITSSGRCQGEAPGTREPTSEPDSWYVWTRDFASEEQCEELYKKVYGSDYWTNEVAPLVPECIDPEGILVERIVPCDDFPEGVSAAGVPLRLLTSKKRLRRSAPRTRGAAVVLAA